jgi:dihydrofolate reductase
MGKVAANMSMSLDGYIADPDDGVERLFGWYFDGDTEVPHHAPYLPPFRVSAASATVLRQAMDSIGALVAGRHLFDVASGWAGQHPVGVPVFVVTHEAPGDWAYPDAPFTFVTDGVASAIEQAQAVAGDRFVSVASPTIAQQCLELGLLDEISVDLIPVLLGSGKPFFAGVSADLQDPEVIEAPGVTHLRYAVKR